jgi:hypothetical protein
MSCEYLAVWLRARLGDDRRASLGSNAKAKFSTVANSIGN